MWKVWIPTGAALAAAAAVLIAVFAGTDTDRPARVQVTPSVEIEEPAVTFMEAPPGSEVVEVDFGQNIGTVFEVQGVVKPQAAPGGFDDRLPGQPGAHRRPAGG
jgi:hypothetical protein